MYLFLGTSVLFSLIVVELFFLSKIQGKNLPWKEIVTNINTGHIMVWLFRGVILFLYKYISINFTLSYFENMPIYLQWVIVVFAWDLCFYWSHRLHHNTNLLWKIHHTHHQPEHFNLSLGIRNSWFQPLSSFPFFSILAFLGVPLEQFLVVSGVHYFIQFFNHNAFVINAGFLEKILMTPSHHRVHHAKNEQYIGKNMGGTFIIWDKLFGTFQMERKDVEIKYGTVDNVNPKNPFIANLSPLMNNIFRKIKQKNKNIQHIDVKDFYTISGSFFLFLLFLIYINYEQTWSFESLAPLFAIVFSGTTALGGISNGRKIGLVVWLLLAIPITILYIVVLEITEPYLLLVLFALIIHGIIGFLKFIKLNSTLN